VAVVVRNGFSRHTGPAGFSGRACGLFLGGRAAFLGGRAASDPGRAGPPLAQAFRMEAGPLRNTGPVAQYDS